MSDSLQRNAHFRDNSCRFGHQKSAAPNAALPSTVRFNFSLISIRDMIASYIMKCHTTSTMELFENLIKRLPNILIRDSTSTLCFLAAFFKRVGDSVKFCFRRGKTSQ
jgi:hypothetical protein